MSETPLSADWEVKLQAGLGSAPAPDFEAWRERHAEALVASQPVSLSPPLRTRRLPMSALKWIAATLLVACATLWLRSGGAPPDSVFAAAIPGVDEVQSLTWTTTFYIRTTSADGQRTWLTKELRRHAYRHPGQYRETMLDEAGQPLSVQITDARAGRTLWINHRDKSAVLKLPQYGLPDQRGPFAYVGDILRERKFGSARIKSIALNGQREVDKSSANVVQVMVDNGEYGVARMDFLFDATAKRVVGIWAPNDTAFDPKTAADRDQPAETKWSKMMPIGALNHEIVLNPKFEPSDFSLDPPAGYLFEKQAKPTVTEEEFIVYLGAAAKFNDNMFPDSSDAPFDSDKFNTASFKPEADRTTAEQELIAIRDKIMLREIYRSPIKQFAEDQTTHDSFHYVGSGVKVGQADRIVCWYHFPKAAQARVVYGDLSVKDVADTELPLDLSK